MTPLEEFALRPWGHQRRGIVIDRTPERLLEAQPSFPIAGPNHVCLVRTRAERVPALLAEARDFFGGHGVPHAWILDPEVEPPNLGGLLAAHGLRLLEELTVMVLPAEVEVDAPAPGITFRDGLGDFESFRLAAEIQAAAFGGGVPPGLEARWEEIEAGQNRHLVIACADGVPAAAGWAWVTPRGTQLNGGASLPELRGRGLYRATVWERRRRACEAGSPGLTVQAGPASQPILKRLGFRGVGTWRRFA